MLRYSAAFIIFFLCYTPSYSNREQELTTFPTPQQQPPKIVSTTEKVMQILARLIHPQVARRLKQASHH